VGIIVEVGEMVEVGVTSLVGIPLIVRGVQAKEKNVRKKRTKNDGRARRFINVISSFGLTPLD